MNVAKEKQAIELWIVFDTFSYDGYPVYIIKDDNIEEKTKIYSSNMQRIMSKIKL